MTQFIVLDLETTGLEIDCDIHCVGFAYRVGDEIVSEAKPWVEAQEILEYFINDPDVVFVIHNAAYDVPILRHNSYTINPGKYVCTHVMAYLTHPGESHSLEAWGERLGYPKTHHEDWSQLSQEMLDYCANDCVVTLKLFEHLSVEYDHDDKLWDVFQNLEMPYSEVIMEMERIGMYLDEDKIETLNQTLSERIDSVGNSIAELVPHVPSKLEWKEKDYEPVPVTYKKGYHKSSANLDKFGNTVVYDHSDLDPFNPNSGDQLAHVLMTKYGWKPKSYSKKTGKPVVDSDVLDKLDYPLVELLLNYRELAKLKSTFVDGLREATCEDGFARGRYNQCVTRTARLSSSAPNLQNLPARSELGSTIRDCVTAPNGWVTVVGDLDRIELCVLSYYLEQVCGESRMSDAIREGVDVHQANADTWGCERTQAKTVIFLIVYGGQAQKLGKTLRITTEEAQTIIDKVFDSMPALRELMELVWSQVRRTGELRTLYGHRFPLPAINSGNAWERSEAERQSFNYLIQGTAGAIFKELQLRAWDTVHRLGGRYVGAVHDESIYYFPADVAEAASVALTHIYSTNDILQTRNSFVPIRAEFHAGESWNAAKNA